MFFQHLCITLAAYGALTLSYLGYGWTISRWLSIEPLDPKKLFRYIWLGWAIVLLLFQVLHIFTPISAFWSIFFLGSGVVFAIYFMLSERRQNHVILSVPPIWVVLAIIAAVWISIQSMPSPVSYDSGLYHFNSIRWINEHPIVLGLGNLHGRLAFNQSFFTYSAYLNIYPLYKHGHNIANSFLLLLLIAECLLILTNRIFKRDTAKGATLSDIYFLFITPAVFLVTLHTYLSSPVPDVASSILQFLLFGYFINEVERAVHKENNGDGLLLMLILAATTVTLKLSNLIYVVTICVILLVIIYQQGKMSLQKYLAWTARTLAIPALIVAIWSFRGIILSGCPLYPSTFGCIEKSWSVPIQSVKTEAAWVYSWPRQPMVDPDIVLGSWDWLEPWLRDTALGNIESVVYPLSIAVLLTVILAVLIRRSGQGKKQLLWLPLPILMGLIFWFFTAPDVRFVRSLFQLLPVAVGLAIIGSLTTWAKHRSKAILLLFIVLNLGIGSTFFQPKVFSTKKSQNGYAPTHSESLITARTFSGLNVFVPANGDQCWNSELPCTPYFNDKLEFIDRVIFPEFRLAN